MSLCRCACGESSSCALRVRALLSMKRWRALLAPQGPWHAAHGAIERRALPTSTNTGASVGARVFRGECCKVRGQVGICLVAECSGHALHDGVLPLPGAIVVELLVNDVRGKSGEVREGVCRTDSACAAVTACAAFGERGSALGIAGNGHAHRFHVQATVVGT